MKAKLKKEVKMIYFCELAVQIFTQARYFADGDCF